MRRIRLTPNFYLDEFACSCCGGVFFLDDNLVQMLQLLRDKVNVSVVITSGCRCIDHQKAIYKSKGKEPNLNSAHLFGKGVDIKLIGEGQRRAWSDEYLNAAKEIFNGIGVTASRRWIHVDIKDRIAEWTYDNE